MLSSFFFFFFKKQINESKEQLFPHLKKKKKILSIQYNPELTNVLCPSRSFLVRSKVEVVHNMRLWSNLL